MNKPSKNIKVEVFDSDSGEKKPIKKEADDTPVEKIDDVVGVSRGYTDYHQGRGHSIRMTAALINIHEHLI